MALTSLGGAIYKDGDPVTVILAPGESTTVPSDAIWDVEISSRGGGSDVPELSVNGTAVARDGSYPASAVLEGGTNLSETANGRDGVLISGWAV